MKQIEEEDEDENEEDFFTAKYTKHTKSGSGSRGRSPHRAGIPFGPCRLQVGSTRMGNLKADSGKGPVLRELREWARIFY